MKLLYGKDKARVPGSVAEQERMGKGWSGSHAGRAQPQERNYL